MPKLVGPHGIAHYKDGVVASADVYERFEGSEIITRMFLEAISRKSPTYSWDFKKQVIKYAVGFFGDFGDFIRLQEENPYLHGLNYKFFCDTLNFIETGQREVSVQNWFDLLTRKPAKALDRSELQKKRTAGVKIESDVFNKTDQVISLWCSNSHGFEDLLYTLQAFFGKTHTS